MSDGCQSAFGAIEHEREKLEMKATALESYTAAFEHGLMTEAQALIRLL